MTLTPRRKLDIGLSALAHVLTLTTMALFILFVEMTILEAGITGVNTIRTTGQLIPFVIGVFSLIVATRDLAMLMLWKVSGRYARIIDRRFADKA
jgi:amino acid transporter